MTVRDIAEKFGIEGVIREVRPYGDGHINDTFLVKTTAKKYVMQRINTFVFTDAEVLMNNIVSVTSYLNAQIDAQHGDVRQKIRIIPTIEGKYYYKCNEGCFRMYTYADHTRSVNIPLSNSHFKKGAVCFATFVKYLLDYPADTIVDVIPDFHNTRSRYKAFISAVKDDEYGRLSGVKDLVEFVKQREKYVGLLVDKLDSGLLPCRVTHNDTKFNNLLLDDETYNPVAVIDFDTIMKGTICYDFGDAIRAGCNSAEEDEADLNKVYFDFDKYEAFAQGYLSTLGQFITEEEKDNLAFSCILITLECGIRFLTDYLRGDCYFKTHYPKQNVFRAKTQFKLVADMEQRFEEMKSVIANSAC